MAQPRIPNLRAALLLAGLWAAAPGARAAVVESPFDCPPRTRGVKHPREDGYVCKPRLEIKKDVFMEEKSQGDPCPEGYWWQRAKRDTCSPVRCEPDVQQKDLGGLCPRGMHPHLNSGADWKRPVECVYNYKLENRKTGGKPFKKGECGRCTIDQRDHIFGTHRIAPMEDPLRAERKRREAENKKKRISAGAKGGGKNFTPLAPAKRKEKKGPKPRPCPAGKYSFRGGCRKCGPYTMTVRRKDGATFCIGGASEVCRESGAPVPTSNAFQPYVCKACDPAQKRVVVNGWPQCLAHACTGDKLPVPREEKGLADCVRPLELPEPPAAEDKPVAAPEKPEEPAPKSWEKTAVPLLR